MRDDGDSTTLAEFRPTFRDRLHSYVHSFTYDGTTPRRLRRNCDLVYRLGRVMTLLMSVSVLQSTCRHLLDCLWTRLWVLPVPCEHGQGIYTSHTECSTLVHMRAGYHTRNKT